MASPRRIPRTALHSWMHDRVPLPRVTRGELRARWRRQPIVPLALDAFLSRVMKWTGLLKPGIRHVTLKLVRGFFRWMFRILNRLHVHGADNIPETGALFYVNHPGVYDPMILLAALPKPFGALISWGNGWFSDMVERFFGFVASRGEPREVKVEKMVHQVLTRNRYFAIWPEGHPTKHDGVERGFSSIVRVYAVLNSRRDRVPFVPVLIRGAQVYQVNAAPHVGPIDVHILEPFFVDRAWLRPPDAGGKTPREIVDYLMERLAHARGQRTLKPNPRLLATWRRHGKTPPEIA